MSVSIASAIPENEAQRLAAVRRYEILDTPPDGAFDRITAIAARRWAVPIAIVSIVDSDRIWFKSRHGLQLEQTGRYPGLCASAILKKVPHLLPDARLDARALCNPLVAGEFGLRFYLGIPLTTHDGYRINDARHELRVSDEGGGLPPGFDPAAGRGLGMKVVTTLVGKLDGRLACGCHPRGRGACFTIAFAIAPNSAVKS